MSLRLTPLLSIARELPGIGSGSGDGIVRAKKGEGSKATQGRPKGGFADCG